MESFLAHVPLASHGRFVRHLELNTVDSEGCDVDVQTVSATAVALLSGCNHIYSLSILMEGSLDASVLPCFARLPQLRAMTLSNTADEDTLPLYVSVSFAHCYELIKMKDRSASLSMLPPLYLRWKG